MRSWWISPRRVGLGLCLVGFLWGITLINFTIDRSQRETPSPQPEQLRDEIISLSEAYVSSLARDQRWVRDGPRIGLDTGYDLKRPMAVLLQAILGRLDRIETQISVLSNDSAVTFSSRNLSFPIRLPNKEEIDNSKQTLVDLITSKVSCELTGNEKKAWPDCAGKVAWMEKMWRQDTCYQDYGVDGTICAFRIYLSHVESWCPEMDGLIKDKLKTSAGPTFRVRLPGASPHPINIGPLPILHRPQEKAGINLDLNKLFSLFKEKDKKQYDWIKLRLRQHWPLWTSAAELFRTNYTIEGERHKKSIVIFMGLLSHNGWNFGEGAFRGGPLGELVQWSDLISSLHILGHSIEITSKVDQFVKILLRDPHSKNQGCPPKLPSDFDLIFTDISGLRMIKHHLKSHKRYACRLRVLDSFGTEAPYNDRTWVMKSQRNKKIYDTQWGKHELNLKQFYTMFPHSPDNTFLGFVVEEVNSSLSRTPEQEERRNISLVYGKDRTMWEGKENLVRVIHEAGFEVHGTVFLDGGESAKAIPDFVINHGLLAPEHFQRLLRRTKLFVGLGFPYEGPAPLEAIANGAIFLNPKFSPPRGRGNTDFFNGKPTSRNLTSQHPYVEEFVKHSVITVDIEDADAVKKALEGIKKSDTTPHLPFEYTALGTLQRVALLLENQDFCNSAFDFDDFPSDEEGGIETLRFNQLPRRPWPPKSSFIVGFASPGQNCKEYCHSSSLICDSSFLPLINSQAYLRSYGLSCSKVRIDDAFHLPAFNAKAEECLLQRNSQLRFSCVAAPPNATLQRICPCRDYIEEQTAICKHCLFGQPWIDKVQ